MIKRILYILTVFMSLCISVCAETVSYDFNSKTVENTGEWTIIKKGEELYFSGENDFIKNIELEKGDKIVLLKWNSYADIKPLPNSPYTYTVCTIDYMCEGLLVESGMSFLETEHTFPSVPEKNGYEIKWSYKQQGENHIVADAEYVICDYTVTFKADGQTVSTDTYNINNTAVSEPAVPKKEGYNGRWEDYTLTYGDREINAVYTPIEYTVTFEGGVKKTFTIEDMSVEEPEIPQKAGYTAKWEDYELTLSNITVKAVYELIEYEVKFIADKEVATEKYTVENKNITKPAVPEKQGYTGKWESYELSLENITVNAVYTPIEYKVTFKAENFEESRTYTIENKNITEPAVPHKNGYTAKWEDYALNLENITVNAVYTVIEYKVIFKAEDLETVKKYTIENKNIEEPKAPEKAGYTVKWESYSLNLENITVNAVYTPIEYKVTFVADGIVATEKYTVENYGIYVPEVPEKTGYSGVWEEYELTIGDKTVNAVYTPKTFTVYFDVNGGNELDITEMRVTYGTEYGYLPTPVHSNTALEFAGWTINSKPIGNVVAITEDCVFTAIWTDKPVYNVIFNDYYGENQHRYSSVIEGQKADKPENPVKKGYEFAGWYTDALCENSYDFSQPAQGEISLYPKWDIITYTVTFVSEDDEISVQYNIENKNIAEPTVPEKTGYTGKWENYSLNLENITVKAVYIPIEYMVTFTANGNKIATRTYTIESLNIDEPQVPQKNGYSGKWESYSLNLENKTVNAVYEIITYTVTFVADGNVVDTRTYTVEKPVISKPAVPRKTGYNGKWESYTLTYGDVTVNAVYTPITYYVYFLDENGVPVDIKTYTVKNAEIEEPKVPGKTGHMGKWQDYTLGAGNVSVYPVYTLINYTVSFMASGESVSVQTYTYTNPKITEPTVPEKTGYTARWESYSLNMQNITVNAVYTPIEYKVTFVAGGKTVAEEIYTVENKHVYAPAVPKKEGCTAKWESYSLNLANITVNAVYTPIEYTITFTAEGKEISVQKFNIENMNIVEPSVPEKTGYTAEWESYSLELKNINVKAVYELIEYTATFKIDNEVVSIQKFNVENMNVIDPEIPAKTGYTAKWESYELTLSNITVNAVYEIITYTVKFMAGGAVVANESYTVQNMTINEPPVPEKAGYTGKWSAYRVNLENITVDAVYTPIEYTAKFEADGVEISNSSYNVETGAIAEPPVPEKEWYDGKWETYSLGVGGVTVKAVYTPATYTISFKADGKEIATQSYDINKQTVNLPEIPVKVNHRAVWERYEVVPGGMTINVRYISKETDAENAEELKHYSNIITDFENTSQIGTERKIIMNLVSIAKVIVEDINYGIIIEENYIRGKFGGEGGIIEETRALNSTLTSKQSTALVRYVAITVKEGATYDYFLDFYEKYF